MSARYHGRTPAETKLLPPSRSSEGFQRSNSCLGNHTRYGVEELNGFRGRTRDANRRPLYDSWHDEFASSTQGDRRSPHFFRYTHTTNYPNRMLTRRSRSVNGLYGMNDAVTDDPSTAAVAAAALTDLSPKRSPHPPVRLQSTDRQTQTTVDRYTQTTADNMAPNDYSTYYRQLLSAPGHRSPTVDHQPTFNTLDIKHLQSYISRHGPAVYRYGGKGAPWRHLKMTCGISGENIMFVDGAVKEYDSRYFPLASARSRELEVPANIFTYRPFSVVQY